MKKIFRIVGICAIILSICIYCVMSSNYISFNITDDYNTYIRVKDIKSTSELKSYLDSSLSEYTVENSTLKINNSKFLIFNIYGEACNIVENTVMLNCLKLNTDASPNIKTVVKINNGTKVEEKSINSSFMTIKNINDNYFFDFSPSLLFIFTFTTSIGMCLIVLSFFALSKKEASSFPEYIERRNHKKFQN